MTYFIFAGDMLVMLFMTVVVIWAIVRSPKSDLDQMAALPLHDEEPDDT